MRGRGSARNRGKRWIKAQTASSHGGGNILARTTVCPSISGIKKLCLSCVRRMALPKKAPSNSSGQSRRKTFNDCASNDWNNIPSTQVIRKQAITQALKVRIVVGHIWVRKIGPNLYHTFNWILIQLTWRKSKQSIL